nr:MAG: hypothetical protein [Bacteriophage sp.]
MEMLEIPSDRFLSELALSKRLTEVDMIANMINHERERLLTAYKEYVDDLTRRTLITHKPRNLKALKLEIYLGIINEDNWEIWASISRSFIAKLIGWNYKLMQDAWHISGEGFDAVESYQVTLMHGLELLEQNGGEDWLDIVDEAKEYWV